MILNDLETDLQIYCKTQNSSLFETKLYKPFKAMAAYIATKYKVPKNELNEIISDMVSHASIKLPEKYNSRKGTAKCLLYIVMSQYLNHLIRYDEAGKRDKKLLIFIEDLDKNENNESHLIEISVSNISALKETLLTNRHLFDKMTHKMQIKIKNTILRCIEAPNEFIEHKGSYINDIAKKCDVVPSKVYYVIKKMNSMINSKNGL